MKIDLQPGDVFCSRNPMLLGRAINRVQKFYSVDNQSEYSHAGVIVSVSGVTFEALWTVKHSHISNYAGEKILILRHDDMDYISFLKGYSAMHRHLSRIYPFHRFIFYLFGPLAKYAQIGKDFLVCSEEVFYFLNKCGFSYNWRGKMPDHLADMQDRKKWNVIFEGVL